MALSETDKRLLKRCLDREPGAWKVFVDRFVGLVVHAVNHTGNSRSLQLFEQDREDFAAAVFRAILADDFAVLRRFRGTSSLAAYLTVISRRVVVRELLNRKIFPPAPAEPGISERQSGIHPENGNGHVSSAGQRFDNWVEVQKFRNQRGRRGLMPNASAQEKRKPL